MSRNTPPSTFSHFLSREKERQKKALYKTSKIFSVVLFIIGLIALGLFVSYLNKIAQIYIGHDIYSDRGLYLLWLAIYAFTAKICLEVFILLFGVTFFYCAVAACQLIMNIFIALPILLHGVSGVAYVRIKRIYRVIGTNYNRQLRLPGILAAVLIMRFMLPIITHQRPMTLEYGLDFFFYGTIIIGIYVTVHEAVYVYRLRMLKARSKVFNKYIFSKTAFLRLCYAALGFVLVIIIIAWVVVPILVGVASGAESYFKSNGFFEGIFQVTAERSRLEGPGKSLLALGIGEHPGPNMHNDLMATLRMEASVVDGIYEYSAPFLSAMLKLMTIILIVQLLVKITLYLSVNTGPREFYRRITASLIKSFAIGFGAPLVCRVVFWQTDADPFTMTNLFVIIFSFIIFSAGEALRASD